MAHEGADSRQPDSRIQGLWMRLGPEALLELLALLAITGVPQIVGYTVARTLRRRRSAAAESERLGLR